jgi:hypothetical protein
MTEEIMGTVVYNPTNEEISAFHDGVEYKWNPEDKIEIGDTCANHILQTQRYEERGLVKLKYGDNEKVKGTEGLRRFKEFKKKQISIYNQTNTDNKIRGVPYIQPTETVKKYAMQLGIELLEPYNLKETEKAAIAKSTDENIKLKGELKELREQMTEMMKMMKADQTAKIPK